MRKFFLILSFVVFIGVSCNLSGNDNGETSESDSPIEGANQSNPEIAILQTAMQRGYLPPKGWENSNKSEQPENPLTRTSEGRIAFKFINKNNTVIYYYGDMTWEAPFSKSHARGTWTMDVNNESSVNRTSEVVVDKTQEEVKVEEHPQKDEKNINFLKTCASCGVQYSRMGFIYSSNNDRIEELEETMAYIIAPCSSCSWINDDSHTRENYLFCSRRCGKAFMDTK
jgi:hypothetical protein